VCYNFKDPNSHNNTLPFGIITGDGVGEYYDVIERAWGPRIMELLACDGNSDFKIDLVDVGLDPVALPTYDFSPCCACGGEAVGGFTLDCCKKIIHKTCAVKWVRLKAPGSCGCCGEQEKWREQFTHFGIALTQNGMAGTDTFPAFTKRKRKENTSKVELKQAASVKRKGKRKPELNAREDPYQPAEPPPSGTVRTWCKCKKPREACEDDTMMIKCSACRNWMHQKCELLTDEAFEEAADEPTYKCTTCQSGRSQWRAENTPDSVDSIDGQRGNACKKWEEGFEIDPANHAFSPACATCCSRTLGPPRFVRSTGTKNVIVDLAGDWKLLLEVMGKQSASGLYFCCKCDYNSRQLVPGRSHSGSSALRRDEFEADAEDHEEECKMVGGKLNKHYVNLLEECLPLDVAKMGQHATKAKETGKKVKKWEYSHSPKRAPTFFPLGFDFLRRVTCMPLHCTLGTCTRFFKILDVQATMYDDLTKVDFMERCAGEEEEEEIMLDDGTLIMREPRITLQLEYAKMRRLQSGVRSVRSLKVAVEDAKMLEAVTAADLQTAETVGNVATKVRIGKEGNGKGLWVEYQKSLSEKRKAKAAAEFDLKKSKEKLNTKMLEKSEEVAVQRRIDLAVGPHQRQIKRWAKKFFIKFEAFHGGAFCGNTCQDVLRSRLELVRCLMPIAMLDEGVGAESAGSKVTWVGCSEFVDANVLRWNKLASMEVLWLHENITVI
jgi:hypothetical protein